MKDITCLAEGIIYYADSSLTGLNLNEVIVGGTGSGKSFSNEAFHLSGGEATSSPWIPSYIEETNSGMKEIDLRTRHFSDRRIFLTGEVDDRMANDFVSQILFLSKEKKTVDIYLNSPGGSVNAGLVIYDLIQSCGFPVNIYCTGMAYSMGAVLLAGGQKGRRFILPHSKVMLHEPLIIGGMGGSTTSVKKTAEHINFKVDISDILRYNKYTYSGTSERRIIILKLLKPFRLTIPV